MTKKTSHSSLAKAKGDSNADVLKKMSSIADATKVLSNEVRSMSKIFAENQKILISLKNMIDAVTSALDQIQRNARQINILEEDTQKLFSGLSQVKTHSNLITKVNEQTNRLQEQVSKVREKQESFPDVNKIMQSVADSVDSIRNNTKMIMHVSDKTEKIQDEIKKVSSKTESLQSLGGFDELKKKMDEVSSKAEKISKLEENMANIKQEISNVTSKTESLVNVSSDIRDVGIELGSLVRKTDSLVTFGADIRNVSNEFANFKENVMGKTKQIDEKISDLTELLNRNTASNSEFHKKAHEIHQELQEIRGATHKTAQNTSREIIGLLRLSEFQSNLRMHSESKYGSLDDLDKMISQTAEMVNLFDRLSIESDKKIPLPQEVKKWSISKILDCADRWEIRFTDVFRLLINLLGRDLVKDSLRVEQIRDLFGIRAVDEVRQEIGIS
ncbi:MAG: chemotaxis protein [Nitrosopumilaceae archaeon]